MMVSAYLKNWTNIINKNKIKNIDRMFKISRLFNL